MITLIRHKGLKLFFESGSKKGIQAEHENRLRLIAKRADKLLTNNFGGTDLGDKRLQWLLKVQDPGYFLHNGIDLQSAGAGTTIITQSASKRLTFDEFKPGIGKLRQSTYPIILKRHLSKDQMLALFQILQVWGLAQTTG